MTIWSGVLDDLAKAAKPLLGVPEAAESAAGSAERAGLAAGRGIKEGEEAAGTWVGNTFVPGWSHVPGSGDSASTPSDSESDADSGKAIAEQDAAQLKKGKTSVSRNGVQTWVDPHELTPKEMGEEARQADTGPIKPAAAPTPESTYEQVADAQANQYLQMTSSMFPSSSSLAATDTAANQGAEAMLGQSSTSPMAQWLNQQSAASQAQYAPVAAAESSVEGAEQNATNLEAGALRGLGTAETAAANAAPYTALLSALANEVPYQLVKGYLPSWTSAPSWLQQGEKGAGVSITGQSTSSPTASSTGVPILPTPSFSTESSTPTTPESTTASLTQ